MGLLRDHFRFVKSRAGFHRALARALAVGQQWADDPSVLSILTQLKQIRQWTDSNQAPPPEADKLTIERLATMNLDGAPQAVTDWGQLASEVAQYVRLWPTDQEFATLTEEQVADY